MTLHVVSRVLPLIVLGSLAVYITVRQVVLGEFDSALRHEMQVLSAAAERVGTGVDFDYGPEREMVVAFDEGLDYYFQATLSDGSLLKQSDGLRDARLEMDPGAPGQPNVGPIRLPSGKMGRGCTYTLEPRVVDVRDHDGPVDRPDAPPGPVRIIIAASTGDVDRPLVALAFSELLVGAVLLTVTLLAVRRTVHKGLAPVEELAHQVTAIEPGILGARVNVSRQPAELTPIASRLNELLDRVEEAFGRERRFTANAAHELRTPIAEIRAIAEVAAGDADPAEARKSLSEIAKVCGEMDSTIASLLAIARTRSGTLKVEPRPVDIAAFMTDFCAKRLGRAQPRVSCRFTPGLFASTDPALLTSIVSNLLDNALAYSSGEVELSAHPDEGAVRLTFTNACAGLSEADLRDMFDPFWRKRGTTVEGNHSGLGLALVRALCDTLGAAVWAQLASPQRLAVCVKLPMAETGREAVPVSSPGRQPGDHVEQDHRAAEQPA
jgi:two-component system sensor histidine kinase QseC